MLAVLRGEADATMAAQVQQAMATDPATAQLYQDWKRILDALAPLGEATHQSTEHLARQIAGRATEEFIPARPTARDRIGRWLSPWDWGWGARLAAAACGCLLLAAGLALCLSHPAHRMSAAIPDPSIATGAAYIAVRPAVGNKASPIQKFSSLREGIRAVGNGGTLRVLSGSIREPVRIDKPMRLIAGSGNQHPPNARMTP